MSDSKLVTRRQMLRKTVALSMAAAGLAAVAAACKPKELHCDDTTGLAPVDIATRKALEYVDRTADPNKDERLRHREHRRRARPVGDELRAEVQADRRSHDPRERRAARTKRRVRMVAARFAHRRRAKRQRPELRRPSNAERIRERRLG